MAIPTNREALDVGSPGGCRVRGLAREVIDGGGDATDLTAGQSGALVVFSTAAGQAYTLPVITADDIGMWFDFIVTIIGTGTYSATTDSATVFLGGGVDSCSTTVAEGGESFLADIAATTSYTGDSDVTGRHPGTNFCVTALTTTTWSISGTSHGTGNLTTPF